MFFGLLEEAGEAVEDAVIRNGECLLFPSSDTLAEAVGAGASVQQAMIRMDVRVDKFSVFLRHLLLSWRVEQRE